MFVFIDTNIFLSFYHLTNEDLIELEKLLVLIKNKEIWLYVPEQVIDETRRNRASKINDSLSEFKKAKFSLIYPAYCKDYPHYKAMKDAQKELEKQHAELLKDIESDIAKKNLKADILIDKLFEIATIIPKDEKILSLAKERVELGNPPGKKGSLGDAVNWESLIKKGPKKIRFCFITDDSDYYSPLDTSKFDEFLYQEWKNRKEGGEIIFYRKLSQFFKDHYPTINLTTEIEKDILIERLSVSSTFAETHLIIAQLEKYDAFTLKQIEDLAQALLNNNQIRWIIDDEDVNRFYKKLYETKTLDFIFLDNSEEIKNLIFPSSSIDEEIPF